MKTYPRQWLLCAVLACLGPLTVAALAETATAENPAAPANAAVAPATATAAVNSETSSVPPPAAPSEPASVAASSSTSSSSTPAASTPSSSAAPGDAAMRRLDQPAAPAPTPSAAPSAPTASAAPAANPAPEAVNPEPAPAAPAHARRRNQGNDRVVFGGNATVAKGESAGAVVAIMGSATSDGEVSDAVVSILGNTRVTGSVGDSAVAVLGNVYVDCRVKDAVAVLGNVELGPNAEVMGDAVSVGGVVKRDPKAIVHGSIPAVGFGVPAMGFHTDWLQAYLQQCVFKLRPLAIGPNLGWAWGIALGFLAFYLVLALLFRGGIEKTVSVLETRPGGSILAALLTVLLTPVLFVLLCITVVGVAVVPFLAVALFCAAVFGKATMLAWLGRRVTRYFGEGPMAHPAFAVLIGGVIVLALYLVPVLGLVVYKLLGLLGVGVVVYTLLLASKRDKPPRAAMPAPAPVPVAPVEPMGFAAAGVGGMAGAAVATEPVATAAAIPPVAVASLPRAGFWIRLAALAIDVVLVAIVLGIAGDILPRALHIHIWPGMLLVLAAYGAVLWKIKGTTVGGIICGLRVVRLDHRPVDWATAIVRALGCFLSLFVVGLGFIWTAIDDEKQSWHDKIAGTTVVHARGSVSLV